MMKQGSEDPSDVPGLGPGDCCLPNRIRTYNYSITALLPWRRQNKVSQGCRTAPLERTK